MYAITLRLSDLFVAGVLAASFAKPFKNMTTFLEKLSAKEKDAWRKQTGKSADESLRNALIEHVGKSLSKLFEVSNC